jgi:hypothetical protein
MDFANFKDELLDLDDAFTVTTMSMFEFQGFDPIKLYHALLAREGDPKKLKKDVQQMLLFTQMRGTNLAKSKGKMEADGVKALNALVTKYGLKQKALKGEDITAARVSATFPMAICNIRRCYDLPSLAELDTFPKELWFFGSVALIEKESDNYAKYVAWAKKASVVIKSDPSQVELYAAMICDSYKGTKTY